MPISRVSVERIRPRGGEGLEVKQRVKVVRVEGEGAELGENLQEGYQKWEDEKHSRIRDQMTKAEVRGKSAGISAARSQWLQEKLNRAGPEIKRAVRLVEDLRSAELVSRPIKKVHIVDVVDKDYLSEIDLCQTYMAISDTPGNRVRDNRGVMNNGTENVANDGLIDQEFHLPSNVSERDYTECSDESATDMKFSIRDKPRSVLSNLNSNHLTDRNLTRKNINPTERNKRLIISSNKNQKATVSSEVNQKKTTSSDINKQTIPSSDSDRLRITSSSSDQKEILATERNIKIIHSSDNKNKYNSGDRNQRSQYDSKMKRLVEQLANLGHLDNTEESGLSTILEEKTVDNVDLVPVRGPTPLEDSQQSTSPFPTTSVRREKESDLASVSMLVSIVRDQREALERQGRISYGDTHFSTVEPAQLPSVIGRNNKESSIGKPFLLDQQFVRKVLDLSSNTTLSSEFPDIKVNLVLSQSSDTSVQPQMKKHKIKRTKKPKYISREASVQNNVKDDHETQKDAKLRFYIQKLLDMKHEDIEKLSVTSSPQKDKGSNTSSHQVRGSHTSSYQDRVSRSSLNLERSSHTPEQSSSSSGLKSNTSNSSCKKQVRFVDRLEESHSETGDTMYLQLEPVNTQKSIKDILRQRLQESDNIEESSRDIQTRYKIARQRLQEKLTAVSEQLSVTPSSLQLSSGPLSSTSSAREEVVTNVAVDRIVTTERLDIVTRQQQISRYIQRNIQGSNESSFNFSQSTFSSNSVDSNTDTLSHIDMSDDTLR